METMREALSRMTRIVVVRGGDVDPTPVKRRQRQLNEVIAHVDDPVALARLQPTLRLADVQEDQVSWIAAPDCTLALYADSEYLGWVTPLGGEWVRSTWWAWDMRLREPERLPDWLDEHVPGWGRREL